MFKRNQVEEAIALVLEPGSIGPSMELRTRIKRLLDTDRGLGGNRRSKDPELANFAFYSTDAGGRGIENWFSYYEAFALLTGLRLMRHGWPQGYVVAVLRRVKRELELHYTRVLKQIPARANEDEQRQQRPRAGDIDFGRPDPLLLVIMSKDELDLSGSEPAAVCLSQEQFIQFIKAQTVGHTWTVFNLVNSVHALSLALGKTKPRKRGRSSH